MNDLVQRIDALLANKEQCDKYGWVHLPVDDANALRAALSAPSPAGEAVAWRQQKPTEPGAYWLKGNMFRRPELTTLVRVEWFDGALCVVEHDDAESPRGFLSEWRDDFLWLGPLHPAPPASPAESGWQPIETAPKDGLICIWIVGTNKHGQKWSDQPGEMWAYCYYDSICGEWRTSRPSGHLRCVPERFVTHWQLPAAPTEGAK
jgi:hypothetical protein